VSQENVEIVRHQYAFANRTGEMDRASIAADARFDIRYPGFDVQHDFDDFLAMWLPYRNTVDDWWIEVDELLDGQRGRVFAAVREGGQMRESRVEIRNVTFHVWEIRDGMIVAFTVYPDRADALKAVGMKE
jgi:ketosteroid isomerase-like protein